MVDARLLVIVSLSDGPKHGYAIQADIEEFAGVRLRPGTLYGALGSLERDAMIESLPTQDRRRPFQLTEPGRRQLAGHLADFDRIRRRAASVKLS